MKIKRSARGHTTRPVANPTRQIMEQRCGGVYQKIPTDLPRHELSARYTQLRSAPWTENKAYFCGLPGSPALRPRGPNYGLCDIQRQPALEY